MKIFNLKYVLILSALFILPTSLIESAVLINEVQIKPTEDRFIELYNSGSSEVDLTGWYLQRKTATAESFGSLVSKKYFENKNIPAKGFFVISRSELSQSDIIFESLTLTESNTIQLKDSGQEVRSIIGWGDVSGSVSSNPAEGKSINRDGSNWIIGIPTPGEENTNEVDEEELTEEEQETVEDTGILRISSRIIIPKTIIAGIPFLLGSETKSNKGGTYYIGKFVWNFGDGQSYQFKDNNPFNYTYEYEGEYLLSLSYYDNIFSELPESSTNLKVKVIPAEISISSLGGYQNPYVEIENKTNYDIPLSGWIMIAGNKSFIFPEGTFISARNKIKISPKITGFTGDDIRRVSITSPNSIINSIYPAYVVPKIKSVSNITKEGGVVNQDIVSQKDTEMKIAQAEDKVGLVEEEEIKKSETIDLNLLVASAGDKEITKSKSAYPFIGLGVIIILGVTSFLLLKKKALPEKKEIGDDFDLVE
ncbi:MAG TPA: lamin tail domain-containing protein [Candidatus Paceibacterota bacterium]|nr:lamin tail domain-containing protein [Candidatus Paceibacterota bacterium]